MVQASLLHLSLIHIYIKEKMDLDIQVAKLKLLKANHTSQIYRLEDSIAKDYPQKISAVRELSLIHI